MSYRFKPGKSIDSEVRRIVGKQVALALTEIRRLGDRKSDKAIHEARRHIKKARALIRLVEPVLTVNHLATARRLRRVSRLLAPIADEEAMIGMLTRLRKKYRDDLPPRTFPSLRKGLGRRWARVDRQAKVDHVLRVGASLLKDEDRSIQAWRLSTRGFRAVRPGLRKSIRRSRRAMALAVTQPTTAHYHVWRQRVKDHWLQTRLLEGRCVNELAPYEQRLEALDGLLGEYHNCALLQNALITEAILPRHDTALVLRVLRRYQAELRRQSYELGTQIYNETPGGFVKRIRGLWRSGAPTTLTRDETSSWSHAA